MIREGERPSDAWAVGERLAGTTEKTLMLRWDNEVWTVQPTPNPGSEGNGLTRSRRVSPGEHLGRGSFTDGTAYNPALNCC